MLYPKGPEKKLFILGPKHRANPVVRESVFLGDWILGTDLPWVGDSISCTQEEKNTKILSIKKFIHKLRRLKFVEEKNTMLIKLRKKPFKKIFLKDKKLSSH